jgi:hypothetical protein
MRNIKRGAKKTAKKAAVKKGGAKKAVAKKGTAKKIAMRTTAALAEPAPLRENIPGIVRDLPDGSDWKRAAEDLGIRPFYKGDDSLPFSCLEATQRREDKKVGGVMYSYVNDFRLAEHCVGRRRAKKPF